jgi:hypothetical protein
VSDALVIACPHCNARNRVPPARLAEAPACGQCHAPLFVAKPVALDAAGFDAHAVRADLPVLVDFRAGATRAEMLETLSMAICMGAGPSMIQVSEALCAFDELSPQAKPAGVAE